jgi:hypothetical protein
MENNLVPIELDKTRHLLLDLNAMCFFEKATNKSLWEVGEKFSATDLRALLWACLIHEDKMLTTNDVGNLIHPGNMKQVSEVLMKAYAGAMPEVKEKKESPLPEKPRGSIGLSSGQ